MTMTTKLAVFYGFASAMTDQINENFKQSEVDCLFFGGTTHENRSDNSVNFSSESDNFDKSGARSHDMLDAKIKSIAGVLGDRKVDFLVVSSSTDREFATTIGGDYTVWRDGLFEYLETPLFLSTYLLKHLTPDARTLFLFDRSAFVPLSGQGNYCVSQYALRMAVNILSTERTDAFISSAVVDEDSFAMLEGIETNKTVSVKEEAIEQAKSSGMAKFLKWLLLTIDCEVFSEKQWDSRDTDIQSLWQGRQLHH